MNFFLLTVDRNYEGGNNLSSKVNFLDYVNFFKVTTVSYVFSVTGNESTLQPPAYSS